MWDTAGHSRRCCKRHTCLLRLSPYSEALYLAGDFVDGQREGYGKYINPDGSVAHDGQWKANHPVTDAD